METFSLENFGVNAICGASYTAEVLLLCARNRSSDEEFSLLYGAISVLHYSTAGTSNLP